MAFNNWPWTSLQNLNLDWILRVCKEAQEAADTVDTFDTRITTAQQTAEAADLTATTAANNADTARTEAATAQATANAAQASASAANTAISNIRQVPVSLLADVGKFLKATSNGAEWDEVRQVPDTDGISNGEVLTKTASGYEWTSALGSGGTEVYYYVVDTGDTNTGTGHLSRTGGATLQHMLDSFGIGEIIPIIRFTTNVMSNENTPVFIPLEISTARAIFGAYDSANSNLRIMTVPYGNNATVTLQTIAIGGGGSTGIETAVYGTTPASDIYTWFNAGKSVRCVYGNNIYWLVQCFQSSSTYTAYFAAPIADGLTTKIYYLAVSNTTWTNASVNVGDVIHYSAQSLTDSQKTQARINIGASAEAIRETVSGTSATLDAEVDTMYLCGTMTALTIDTFPPTGEFTVIFTSGSTATTLTVPNTLHMPDGFTVEANKRYEINVLDGYACAQGWSVSA